MNIVKNESFNRTFLIGVLWVLSGSICFSTKAIFVKLAYRHDVDSVSLLALRMLFALPLYLIIGWISSKHWGKVQLKRKSYLTILITGLLGYYFASLFDFLGLQYVTAGIERLVLYMYPTLVLIISAIFFRQKIKGIQILALLLTYVGIAIAFSDKNAMSSSDNFWLGVFFVAMAALSFAIYVVMSGKFIPKLGTIRYTVWTMTAACLAILIHHFINHRLQLFHFEQEVYLFAFLMAIFSTVLPSFMISEGIRRIGANNAAIIGSVGPISTIILAYFFLGELFGGYQILGTIIVIAGVVWLSFGKGRK